MTHATKCSNCAADCSVEKGEFLFLEFGLPLLLQEIQVVRCSECGEEDPIIPNLNGLMKSVALHVLSAERRLTGLEIRFLRKYIGLSSKQFAKKLGCDHTNLSKYENDKLTISPSKDRLIRMITIALGDGLLEHLRVEDLRELVGHFEEMGKAAPLIQPQLLIDPDTMSCQYA